jgi:cytochrome c oxidase cbb3-type subunit 3
MVISGFGAPLAGLLVSGGRLVTAFLASLMLLAAQAPPFPQDQPLAPGPTAPADIGTSCAGNRRPWLTRWETMAPQNTLGAEGEGSKRGKTSFQTLGCAGCHGRNAEGASATDLLESKMIRHDVCGDVIKDLITKGHPRGHEPAAQDGDSRIYDIVDYLHRRIDETDFLPQYNRSELDRIMLTGDVNAGKAYFNGAGGCSVCHSATSDLKNISRYDPLTLGTRIVSPPGSAKATATVTTASGQTVHGQVLTLDSFDVSIQLENGETATWDRRTVKVEVKNPVAPHRDLILKSTDAEIRNLVAYLETLK